MMTDTKREKMLEQRDKLIEALENIEQALIEDVPTFAASDEDLDVEQCVKFYLLLREARERAKDRAERRDKELRNHQQTIEGALGAFMQRVNTEGLNTKYGTIFTAHQSTARIADKDAFLSFLKEQDAWHLATIGANKATVSQHLEEHEGNLPPGVDYSTRIVVQIRRK
jgi:hypothetical protein